jgi:hypothetical protein
MNEKVIVTSAVSGKISLVLPHLRVKKTWPKKGTKLPIDKELLREAIYEPGVEYMFKQGMLYIEDMDFKIELGLEAEGTENPTEIIPVNEEYLFKILKHMSSADTRKAIGAMNANQKRELVDYACKMNDIQLDKMDIIRELTGVNVVEVISLNRQKGE